MQIFQLLMKIMKDHDKKIRCGLLIVEILSSVNRQVLAEELANCIGGSVVECSPATRAARVRFPADAHFVRLSYFD